MAEISIDLGIAKIIRELREWWEKAKARGDAAENEATRSSAQRLAVGFVQMAGLLETFADQLGRIPIEGSRQSMRPPKASEIGRELQYLLRSMHTTLAEIQSALKAIDLEWGVTHLGVLDDANTLFHMRSMAVGRIEALVLTLENGEAVLVPYYEFEQLGRSLRELAAEGRRVAHEIAATLYPGDAAGPGDRISRSSGTAAGGRSS